MFIYLLNGALVSILWYLISSLMFHAPSGFSTLSIEESRALNLTKRRPRRADPLVSAAGRPFGQRAIPPGTTQSHHPH